MRKEIKKTPPSVYLQYFNFSTQLVLLALVFFFPFLPDEKISRLKLLFIECGIFSLCCLTVSRWIWTINAKSENKKSFLGTVNIGAVFFWMIVSSAFYFAQYENPIASQEWRRLLLGFGSFLAFYLFPWDENIQKRFVWVWCAAASLIGLYGVLQHSGGFAMVQVPQMDRVMGTFGNPIFFAAYLGVSIILSVAALKMTRDSLPSLFIMAGILFQVSALFFSQTRASLIGMFFILGFGMFVRFGMKKEYFKYAVGFFILLGATFFLTRHIWSRDQGHYLIWRDTLRMWKDHFLFGVGLGQFHVQFPSYAQADLISKWPKGDFIVNFAHNEYIQTLAETGVVGFLPFLAIVFSFICFWYLNCRKKDLIYKNIYFYSGLGAIFLLIQNFFSVDMRFSVSFFIFFAFLGMTTKFILLEEKKLKLDSDTSRVVLPQSFAPVAIKWFVIFMFFLGMIGFVLPRIFKPYQAQKEVSAAPGFFDERLLDPAKSIQSLEQLHQQYPKEPSILEKLSYAYAKEMKTTDGKLNIIMAENAIRSYRLLSEIDPTRISAYNNMANINYTMGRVDEAVKLWKKAVEIKPDFLDAHLNLGKTLYVQGNLKESAEHFQTVLKIDSSSSEAIVFLKRMVE
ncbi:MAG: tetratricopeptide repeat protein [Elusimicrobiota bacterium]